VAKTPKPSGIKKVISQIARAAFARTKNPLECLEEIKDRQRRGIQFQEILANLLREARFEVHANPLVAKPRQSDLFASHDDVDFLIEAKWLRRKIDASDVDNLRIRLQRTPANLVGCIFSMSDYAQTAIREVEANREREVILFRPDEIRDLFSKRATVADLIKRKRKAFRVDGKTWFLGQRHTRESSLRMLLPTCDVRIEAGDNNASSIVDATPGFEQFVFTRHIPELPWNGFGGHGVGLHLRLEISSVTELRKFLRYVHEQISLSSQGSFMISQRECNWHGFGVENMLSEIEALKVRYQEARLNYVHHSEDICYFDQCRSGFLLFSGRQSVGERSHLRQCELDIILPGIPVDTQPLINISEASGDFEPSFVPLLERQSASVHFHPPIPVEPVHQIHSIEDGEDQIVCGLVVKNPFRTRKKLLPKDRLGVSVVQRLVSPSFLICELSDWHGVGDRISRYRLTRLHTMMIGDTVVLNPAGTWERILDRKPGTETVNMTKFWKQLGVKRPKKAGS
jgi:hypothetical protein